VVHPDKQKHIEIKPKVIKVQEIPSAEFSTMKKRYQENIQRVEELEEKCKMLEDALKYGEVTSLSRMILEYQSMSVGYLEHISKEMHIYRYSYEERQRGLEFIEYLRQVASELERLLWPGGANA